MFARSRYFASFGENDWKKSHGKRLFISMDGQATLGCLFILLTLPTIVMSTTSTSCNTTQICLGKNARNTSGAIDNVTECCRNRSSTSDTNLVQNSGNLNETSAFPTSAVDTLPIPQECLNDSICSSDKICLSVKCFRTTSTSQLTQCLCRRCTDGGCFNKTSFTSSTILAPTTIPPQGITPLQLVLLFGSMGGIVVIICIVYCVKSFTDNRRRQYLLKHGVWDTPREEKIQDDAVENDSSKSETSREDSKMEIPTIRVVQLENEISKSKESKIDTVNEQEDEEDDDISEETEKVLKPKKGPKAQPDVIQVKGYVPIPNEPNESPYHQNANPKRSTKDPYIEKTIPHVTIGSPTEQCHSPASWNKDLSNSPLTDAPVKSHGIPTLHKTKDPPKKIIANGTPEKSPKFNNKTRTASPPKLVEPENFSDFGM